MRALKSVGYLCNFVMGFINEGGCMVIHYYPAQQHSARTQPAVAKASSPWRGLYLLLPVAGLLLLAERRLSFTLALSRTGHLLLQCAIVLVIYGLLVVWLRGSQAIRHVEKQSNDYSQRKGTR